MALVTVTASGADPRTYELNKPRMVLGRDAAADIRLDNLAVSKQHCEIVKDGEAFIARDLGSSNKTFINGKETQEHRLNNGDEIVIGLFHIKFTGTTTDNSLPKPPPADEGFEPTLQLPPEMIRKKMEEMQREKAAGGMNAARLAAASTVRTPQPAATPQAVSNPTTQSSGGSSMAIIIIAAAIIFVILLNVVISMWYKK